jgi:hypothetical protein
MIGLASDAQTRAKPLGWLSFRQTDIQVADYWFARVAIA